MGEPKTLREALPDEERYPSRSKEMEALRAALASPDSHQHRFDVVIRDDAHMRLLGCSNTPCTEVYQWDW